MADPALITSDSKGAFTVIEIVERNIAAGEETIVTAPAPISGTIIRIDSFLESGAATATDPTLYYASPSAAPSAVSIKVLGGLPGGPTEYSDASPAPYGRPGWDGRFVLTSNVDAGSDNFVRTRITIRGN